MFGGTDSAVVSEKNGFWLKFQKRWRYPRKKYFQKATLKLKSVYPQEGYDFQLIIKLWFEGMVKVFSELSDSQGIILRYKNILNYR